MVGSSEAATNSAADIVLNEIDDKNRRGVLIELLIGDGYNAVTGEFVRIAKADDVLKLKLLLLDKLLIVAKSIHSGQFV
jgi:hypothetical protein